VNGVKKMQISKLTRAKKIRMQKMKEPKSIN